MVTDVMAIIGLILFLFILRKLPWKEWTWRKRIGAFIMIASVIVITVNAFGGKSSYKNNEYKSSNSSHKVEEKSTSEKKYDTLTKSDSTKNQKNDSSDDVRSRDYGRNTSSIKRSSSDTYMPDFKSFCNGTPKVIKKEIGMDKTTISYKIDTNQKAVQEYLELLTNAYNFKQKDYKALNGKYFNYAFDYTGKGDVSSITGKNLKGSMNVYISHFPNSINISYGDGIEYVDTGERTTYRLKDMNDDVSSSNSSGSSSAYSSDTDLKPPPPKSQGRILQNKCTKYGCDNGKIECSACEGRGGKYVYDTSVPNFAGSKNTRTASTWQRCSKCNGTGSVDCPVCGGDGYID